MSQPGSPSSPASGTQLVKTKSCKMMRAAKNIDKKKEFLPNLRRVSEVVQEDGDVDNFEEEKMSEDSASQMHYLGNSS